jgi:molybdate transport system ATP-binding protein
MIKANIRKELFTAQGKINLAVDIEIKNGEFATIFGKSGTGKTTILRILAGLVDPEEGFIEVDKKVWFDSRRKINFLPQERHIGFVFEDYALFPNMTVRQNLEFAASYRKEKSFIDELLRMVGLYEFVNRRPAELSAGQKQRVALIRALARKPKVFLFDEPLSALDTETRFRIQDEILHLYRRFGTTTILVSHHVPEVFKLSRVVFLLEEGKIARCGKPIDVFIEEKLSDDFSFVGEVIDIQEAHNTVIVRIGNKLTQITPTEQELKHLNIGDKIMVTASSFCYSFNQGGGKDD